MEAPRRNIDSPKALRALAHPTRLLILELLQIEGPMTATQTAELVGESPANCSFHLRQLARYGFVEEAPGGVGRQRPWRVRVEVQDFDVGQGNAARAAIAASAEIHRRELEALLEWQNARHDEPAHWRSSAFDVRTIAWLTPDELTAMRDAITTMVTRFAHRVGSPGSRPPGARPVRVVAWGVPSAAGAPKTATTPSEQPDGEEGAE